jgi:preprotein translocase subunit YajC
LLANGKTIPIRKLKAGEKVMASDPMTGTTAAERVTRTIVTRTDRAFTAIRVRALTAAADIISTSHHLYWDASRGEWVQAKSLHIGDRLRTIDGTTAIIISVHSYTMHAVTYNLTVDDLHTYYVLAGNVAVLVHNSGGAAVCALGKLGEQKAGIIKNTKPIEINGRTRYPDELNTQAGIIGEVKNVAYQDFSTQLKDDVTYAQQKGYTFYLYVNQDTKLSAQLQDFIAGGMIVLVRF